ncbi:hypothetical protein [uncultured Haemophilus sp.]|uniref:hypothetical protein n=1 Tax=uncultured Haemophilus sp. TaxID=237779 RepID=UPI0025F47A6A|nr:hypothetical protein [uncultured Haemophilus sp.]
MNLNAKVALSLILGASTLLSACDNKENTSTQVEKAVRIPAPTEKPESAVEKSKELVAETKSAEKVAEKTESTEVKADAKKADEKSDAVKAEVKKETKETKADDVAEKASEKKETVVAQQATTPQKPRVVVTEKAPKESAERKQQRAVLNVLEKQYEEVRCSADAKNVSGDSFCRQEERRLFLEIQRIKDELRGIEE